MNAGGVDPSVTPSRVSDGLVMVEREVERRDAGLVATYTITTENERPVAVQVSTDLPESSADGTGFHPAREPRWWTVEDDRLEFKDTVGTAAPATFEFGLAVEGGFDGEVSLPDPEIAHAEPVGVAPESDRMVFPEASDEAAEEPGPATRGPAESNGGGLLSGVRNAVFGGEEEEVVRASDLDPDAMVVSRGEPTPAESERSPTPPHDENPTLTPAVGAVDDRDGEFSALEEDTDVATTDPTHEELRALREEVSGLRADLEAMGESDGRTADRVSELSRAVDGLAAALGPVDAGPDAEADD
jgi:hypothetical protein